MRTQRLPPLETGDHLDRATFHARYEAMPPDTRAQLIGGIVYVRGRVSAAHGRLTAALIGWLGTYSFAVPGVDSLGRVTLLLGDDSEPEPDASLRVPGGTSGVSADGYVTGPPELIAEAALGPESIELHAKLRDYERYGLNEYYVALIRTRRVWAFDRVDARLVRRRAEPGGVLRSPQFPGLWLDPRGLFGDDRARLRAAVEQGLATVECKSFAASRKSDCRPAGTRPSPRSGRRSKR